ncbi:MAG: outer membrane protein assembly factor BamA [Cucumibacter sp.]
MTANSHLVRALILGLVVWLAAPFAGGPVQTVLGVEAAHAQTVQVIVVSGNDRVEDSIVISFLSIGVGGQATAALIDASIDSLYQSGLFRTADVTFGGGTLRVTVVENPIISAVLFVGNQSLSDEQLLALVDLAALGVYSDAAADRGARAIKGEYASQGYTAVEVTPTTEVTDAGRIRVTYNIIENYRAKIAAITFSGNASIGDWNLRSIMQTHQSHLLSFLIRDDVYDESKLNADELGLRDYYANHGFPDAQVSSVVEFDAVRGAYYISINIIEGDRYRFGDIGIETSIDGIDTGALQRTVTTRQGGQYSMRDLETTAQQMALAAADQGYPFADVRPRIDRDIANKQFSITYLVDDGPRLYVERIDIYGNDKTRDFVIRREFDFAEGDPFNRAQLTRAKQNLDALQYFESVSISLSRGSRDDKVVISVAVVERSTGEYAATAGYNTSEGIVGEISLTERNFLGRGQYLKVALSGGFSGARSFDFQFTEPRFMGLRISKGISFYRRVTPEGQPLTYGTSATGGSLQVGLPLTDNISLSAFGGYESKTIIDVDLPSAPLYIGVDGTVWNKAFVGYTLRFSTLDSQQNPTRGFYGQFDQQYVGIDHNFLRSELRGRYYFPVMPDYGVVASIRGQAGIMNDFSGIGVNPIETFSPNSTLVRGFTPRDFGPRDAAGDAVGFTEYLGVSAELEFPIPMLPESYGVSGAVWADAAWVGSASIAGAVGPIAATSIVPIRSSAGASVLWDSPFGPLRGDFAYIISQATDDNTQLFQLTMSTLF